MMKKFATAKMDIRTRLMTYIFGGIIVISLFFIMKTFLETHQLRFIIPISILLVSLVRSWLLVPKIFLSKEEIIIKNSFTTIKIPLISIKIIEKYDEVKFNYRSFGVGGLFGYFGYFNGNDVWHVTNIQKKIKITMITGKIYMISPENTDDFLEEIRKIKQNKI